MKNNPFSLSLLFVLAFCGFSFAQNQVKVKAARTVGVISQGIIPFDCPYPECEQLIDDVKAQYLPLANELCQDLFICVTCCNDGIETYAMVVVRPNVHCWAVAEKEKIAHPDFYQSRHVFHH